MERDIGAGPFDRFDEMSTKKVRKVPKPSAKTKTKSPDLSAEVVKEIPATKKSSSGPYKLLELCLARINK